MNLRKYKYLLIPILLGLSQFMTGCLFETIDQPSSAEPGEIINVKIKITDNMVPEPNAHKGLLGVIVPIDWEFTSATYNSVVGNGILNISAEWNDSLLKYYPVSQFGTNMKWIALISDSGYSYQNVTSFYIDLKLKVGQSKGCFNLGYLTSKATSGLLGAGNTSWAPLSYPHPIGVPDSNLCRNIFKTRRAIEWDNILDRQSGWTGADGIYSIPLNGREAPSNTPADSQLILFSDTFIGDVDGNNHRVNTHMINNSLLLLPSNIPDTNKAKFFWRTDSTTIPKSVFVPNTPNTKPGEWYWLMDGISLKGKIYVYAIKMNQTTGGMGFEVNAVNLLKFSMDSLNFISDVQQFETPLYLNDKTENWEIVLGQAIMPMTNESGNLSPDGYIYIYGPKSSLTGKELVASRVLPEDIENFEKYQYWNGTSWGSSIKNLVPLTNGISQEFSVTPIKNGKYLVTFQMGSSVYVRMGDSPTGPFEIFQKVYDCPEIEIGPSIFIYNAKAHPNLSDEKELLISYNVNSSDFGSLFSNADIYRPRFIYLSIEDTISTVANDIVNVPKDFNLYQNYPNPFNPSTVISFDVAKAVKVSIKIFNIMGEMVTELTNKFYDAGHHQIHFNASSKLSSGVYFYRMEAGKYFTTNKMLLIK